MLNQWLKRTIGKKAISHPVSCCFGPSPLDDCEASTLDELLTCCQRFDVQWIFLILKENHGCNGEIYCPTI